MPIQMKLKAAPHGVPVMLWTDTAESQALDQLKNVARLPKDARRKRVSVRPAEGIARRFTRCAARNTRTEQEL